MAAQESLQDFITANTGVQNVGTTPENTGQCVGLSEKWLQSQNLPFVWGNAKDLLSGADPNYYDIIHNTPTNCPVAGDVLVWGDTWGNGYGHTGVVVSADANSITVFEQNDPLGAAPQVKTYTYAGVLGWLHSKVVPNVSSSVQTNGLPANYDEIIGKSTKYDLFAAAGFSDPTVLQEMMKGLTTARDLNSQLYQGEIAKNADLTAQLTTLYDQVTTLEGQVKKLGDDNTVLKQETADAKAEAAHTLSDYQAATAADSKAINDGLDAEQQLKDLQSGLRMLAGELHCDPTIDALDKAIQIQQQTSAVQVKQQKQIYDFFTSYIQLLIAKFIQKH